MILRRMARRRRSGLSTAIRLILIFAAGMLAWYVIFDHGSAVDSDVIDFSQSTERIQELSTVRSHIRFGVVVREESGNIVVRRLADQTESIGMDGLGSALFQDPTMIVELHGVATYGMRLDDLATRIRQDDSLVTITLPKPEVLDVKLVAADTRVVAQMKGLFRSSNQTLLLEASRRGEEFVRAFAEEDTSMQALAAGRAKDVLALLVEQGGKRAAFR